LARSRSRRTVHDRRGTTLSAAGTLTLTSGAVNTGTLAAQGDISIAAAYTGGTATLLINGTVPQTWSGSSNGGADTLNVVNINDPASTHDHQRQPAHHPQLDLHRQWRPDGIRQQHHLRRRPRSTGSHTLGAVEWPAR